MKKILSLFLMIIGVLVAQDNDKYPENIPDELKVFIETGTKVLDYKTADLNGDGKQDYLLILEKQGLNSDSTEIETGQRPLIIIIRKNDNSLYTVKRNEKIVYCSTCGGVWGDPFESISAGVKTFTVNHFGGSNWRWTNSFKFNYSRIDNTWQLVKVEESSFHTSNPDKMKTKIYKPPKDFGKIDISDFDPDNFKNTGKK